jgi:hypothetical protein
MLRLELRRGIETYKGTYKSLDAPDGRRTRAFLFLAAFSPAPPVNVNPQKDTTTLRALTARHHQGSAFRQGMNLCQGTEMVED